MPKTYVKVITPKGKLYKALSGWKRSNRSFKTATQAEEYAAAWKERYQKLRIAAAEKKEFEDAHDDDDEPDYCQDCGCMLDWEMKGPGDDIVRPGYVTASGDVFCSRCGREYDEEEERSYEEDADDYYEPPEDAYQENPDELPAGPGEEMRHDKHHKGNWPEEDDA